MRIVIVAAVAAAFLALGCGGGGTDPTTMNAGDCFDLPTSTERIGDIRTRGCDGPHGAEVFHVFDDGAAATAAYPTDSEWGQRIFPVCDEAFQAYTNTNVAERLDIEYQYFVATPDRWSAGDRRVTCFIVAIDSSQLSRSFRAAP